MKNVWIPLEQELKTQFGFEVSYCSIESPLILYERMSEDLVELMCAYKGGTKYALGFDKTMDLKEFVEKTIKIYMTNIGEIKNVAIRFGVSENDGLKTGRKDLRNIIYFLQQEKHCSDEEDVKRLNILRKNINEFSDGELVNLLLLSGNEKDHRPEIAKRQATYHEICLGNLEVPKLEITSLGSN